MLMLIQGYHGLKILHLYNALIKAIRDNVKNPDLELIRRAFTFANRAHKDQKRLSGEPYIIHPLAVAHFLAEQGLDSPTIAAALLHDVVEDTGYGEETILSEFGEEVNTLVRSVTKISVVKKESIARDVTPSKMKEIEAAENIRLMLLATAKDIRVILIKLSDKLHNMRTLQFQKPEKIERIASEVMKIYAPIAGRLGMFRVKSELEDLAFANLHPVEYNRIMMEINQSRAELEDYIDKIRKILKQRLIEINIQARVEGRAKHIYSIYNKMFKQDKQLQDIYDLRGIRIIVDEIKDCYGALGIVHTLWPPIPGRFKDYIATPKVNGYQSLHTTVMGPDAKPLEVQIRTVEMDEMADHGIAAHWIYKSDPHAKSQDPARLRWVGRLNRIIESIADSESFIEDLSHELSPEEVYVFTPRGDIIDLPVGGTVLDFAFRIHTDVGLRCKGARVNDRMVPLRTELKSGDRVEVLTDRFPNPSPNWLRYLKSQRARQKLRQYLARLEKEEGPGESDASESGSIKRKISFLRRIGGQPTHPSSDSSRINEKKSEAKQEITATTDLASLPASLQELRIRRGRTGNPKEPTIEVAGERDIPVRYAGCCSPVPGDEIVGFITRGRGVTIHRKDCHTIPHNGSEIDRLVPVKWEGLTEKYPVEIEIHAMDRQGLYMDMVGCITKTYTNILKAEADLPRNGEDLMMARFLIEVEHVDHLREILEALQLVDGVQSVARVHERKPIETEKKARKKSVASESKEKSANGETSPAPKKKEKLRPPIKKVR